MNLNGEQKALVITLSLSVGLLLFLANLNFIEQKQIIEDFFEVETVVEMQPEENTETEELSNLNKAETNKAFNDSKKDIAQSYERIKPAEDFNYDDFKEENVAESDENLEETETVSNFSVKKTKPISRKKVQAYDKAKRILDQQKKSATQSTTKNSTVSFNLVNRDATYLPIPVYLCDGGGKVVINISVNKSGKVTSAKVNTSLSASNLCLQDFAIKYAKRASFNLGTKKAQLGTITYQFQ